MHVYLLASRRPPRPCVRIGMSGGGSGSHCPNSALLLSLGTVAGQHRRLEAAAVALERRKAEAAAAERYEECAALRDALKPLRGMATAAGGGGGAEEAGRPQLPPLCEGPLLAALGCAPVPKPERRQLWGELPAPGSEIHPRMRVAPWQVDNKYFGEGRPPPSLPIF